MKLQIKGNLVEFQHTIEGFTKNKKEELESRLHRSTIKTVLLFGAFIVLLLIAIIFCILHNYFGINFSLFIAVISFVIAFCYALFSEGNKIDVKYETEQAAKITYGNRLLLLDNYHSGNILSVVIEKLTDIPAQSEILLLFTCQNKNKLVNSYFLKVPLTRTSDINNQGTLILDLESGTGTCYYRGISDLKEITKNNVEFEIVNQFLPKGCNQ